MGKIMFNGVNYSAPNTSANGVTGVKGSTESSYRTGNVNLTPENIGAAKSSIYGDTVVSMGRKEGTTVGDASFAFGDNVEASGNYSHAEGSYTKASALYSHAEGLATIASGSSSHAEGMFYQNLGEVSGTCAHGEGWSPYAIGEASHAEGHFSRADGNYSHAEGNYTEAIGISSHAEGDNTTASCPYSHAEGHLSVVSSDGLSGAESGFYAHAEGEATVSCGVASHSEGFHTVSKNDGSHAEGCYTSSENYASHASGKYNKTMTSGGFENNQVGDVFVIGNGTNDSNNRSNAFRVTYLGSIYGTKAFQSSGADYAEFIKPWADGNTEEEDRIGYFVTIKNGYLEKANKGDYIAGITSGNPSIVGNADEDYYWRYERDEFNRIVMEDVPELVQKTDEDGNPLYDEETHEPIMEETGNIIPNARMKLAEGYDSSLQNTYIERKDRKEWDYVGMLGVLPVRDDGTCIPGYFCKCKDGGIATLAETRGFDTYMVIERISESIVSVILK